MGEHNLFNRFFAFGNQCLNTGMSVLDVIDRIGAVLTLELFDIKFECGITLFRGEHKAQCFRTDLFDDIAHEDDSSGTFGHLERFTLFEQTYHLREEYFELRGIVTQKGNRRFDTGDVTVMIRSPDVDVILESALEFLVMVDDITRKIRWTTVFTNHYSVMIIAKFGRSDKGFTFVEINTFTHFCHNTIPFIIERRFPDKGVKMDVNRCQIFHDKG